MKFEGSLMSQIKKFKELVDQYHSELEELKKAVKEKLSRIPISRIEAKEKWYLDVLNGKKVVGVDGSQITPLKEIGIPLGAVQVAKVVIIHGAGKSDVKYYSAFVPMEENVDLTRFRMEVETLMEEMDGNGWLFFDGSFILSFTKELNKRLMDEYLRSITALLKKSRETQTPIIGYVDRSYAKDLAKDLGLEQIYDAYLLSDRMNLMEYTPPFRCRRDDVEIDEEVSYVYIRVSPSLPVRIEYPSWMEKMHDEVVRVVAAECMLGSTRGYPYILERAHSYSTIGGKEKMNFIKAVGSHSVSFKWMSKLR